jgi:hypothetical protein
MKPILVITIGLVSVVGGALGAFILGIFALSPAPTAAAAEPESDLATFVVTPSDDGVPVEIASLRAEVDELRTELASLRADRENAVIEEPVAVAAVTASAPSENMILDVLQRKEEREEEERRVEREQREQDALDRRVERIAEKLSLSAADQTTLAQIYTEERAKQTEMWTMMREGSMDRETIRSSMTEVRDWRTEQLTLSFGEDLATQIGEEGGGGRGGFDWGGGGRGGGNGGGRGGRGN